MIPDRMSVQSGEACDDGTVEIRLDCEDALVIDDRLNDARHVISALRLDRDKILQPTLALGGVMIWLSTWWQFICVRGKKAQKLADDPEAIGFIFSGTIDLSSVLGVQLPSAKFLVADALTSRHLQALADPTPPCTNPSPGPRNPTARPSRRALRSILP